MSEILSSYKPMEENDEESSGNDAPEPAETLDKDEVEERANDPVVYLDKFNQGIDFDSHFKNYVEATAKERNKDLSLYSPEAMNTLKAHFMTSPEYKNMLWDWQKEHPLKLTRDLPEPSYHAVIEYHRLLRDLLKMGTSGRSAQEIENLDHLRTTFHTKAAQQLVDDGVAPNSTVGRILVHFMSISERLDYWDPSRDEKRLRYWGHF